LRTAYAQSLAAYSLLFLGRLAEAEPLLAPALDVARSHGRALLGAFVLRAGSHLDGLRGDLSGSRAKLIEALAMYERIGADRHATAMIGSLAELEFRAGDVEHAFELAAKCLNLQRAQNSRHVVQTLTNIAAYSVALDRWDRARAYAREVLHTPSRNSSSSASPTTSAACVLPIPPAPVSVTNWFVRDIPITFSMSVARPTNAPRRTGRFVFAASAAGSVPLALASALGPKTASINSARELTPYLL
jgi:tetratricopeptide (TPR) repeat protein